MTPISDPITGEIIRHRLDGINEEAAIMLRRVSGSQIAVEANDLNTAITTADGTVVACGNYVLCQVASLNLVAADILGQYLDDPGIRPGDQFLTNDPYVGTLHQPDVIVVAPVFHHDRLIAWCGSTVHQSDVGGPTPGGLSSVSGSIFDEPLPIPPVRIVEGDRIRRDIERGYLARSRTPRLNALDLAGQIAANRASVAAIQALCDQYGPDAVVGTMDHLVDSAEQQLRNRLSQLPDGRWRQVCYLERGEPTADDSDVFAVRLTVTKRGTDLEFDFTASSDQAPGGINAAYPALVNFSIAAVLIYLCPDLLWVPGGAARVVRIVSREGTVVHARWPAGVSMSTATSCQAIRVAVNGCLARMLEGAPDLAALAMASCQSSGAGGGVLTGIGRDGEPFGSMTLDELTGGGGATAAADGADSSGPTTSPGAACANVEVNESYLPVLYLHRAELPDSGGPGRHRGGVGCSIALRPHGTDEPIGVISFAQGLQHPAAVGIGGGDPGRQSGFAVLSADRYPPPAGERLGELPLPRQDSQIADRQWHWALTQGGGGAGDPLDRDPAAVLRDVIAGQVSSAGAARDYGVLLAGHPAAPAVDVPATADRRRTMRRERLGGRDPLSASPHPGPAPEPGGASDGRPGDRRLTATLAVTDDRVCCARCRHDLGPADGNPYARLAVQEIPAADAGPTVADYPGAQRFVVRRLHCPACACRVDVQISLRSEPVVVAAEWIDSPAAEVAGATGRR